MHQPSARLISSPSRCTRNRRNHALQGSGSTWPRDYCRRRACASPSTGRDRVRRSRRYATSACRFFRLRPRHEATGSGPTSARGRWCPDLAQWRSKPLFLGKRRDRTPFHFPPPAAAPPRAVRSPSCIPVAGSPPTSSTSRSGCRAPEAAAVLNVTTLHLAYCTRHVRCVASCS